MNQNIARLMVLSILVVLCIWQTVTLWLGDMSGHNFLSTSTVSYKSSYVQAKQTWSNIGGNIYKIISDGEQEELLSEIVAALKKENLDIESSPKEQYAKLLFASKGMIYEFGTALSLEEIMGTNLNVRTKKYTAIKIKEIYVELDESNEYKAYVYLIDEEAKIRQKITINTQLKSVTGVVNLYANEVSGINSKLYQSSLGNINDSEFFVGHAFYPLMNANAPVVGKIFCFKPIISDIKDNELENYVNNLFRNPSNKTTNKVKDGIVFSDNLNISVKYHEMGTLEFKKTFIHDESKLSDIEKLNKINAFIEESEAIPQVLKRGLYLQDVETDQETKETYYRFGYRYIDGEVVLLSEMVKRKLGINAFLELGIKNSEITSGKWLMVEPEFTQEEVQITMESTEAIGKIYEESGLLEVEAFQLSGLECAYIVQDIERSVAFKWVGFYKSQPILTIEKIDNE